MFGIPERPEWKTHEALLRARESLERSAGALCGLEACRVRGDKIPISRKLSKEECLKKIEHLKRCIEAVPD